MPVTGTVTSAIVNNVVVYSLIDTTGELPNGYKFNYAVRVSFDDGVQSALAYDTITGVNDPPVAGTTVGLHLLADTHTVLQASQGAKVTTLTIPNPGVLVNDSAGADSNATSLIAVAASGATTNGGAYTLAENGSFTYMIDSKFLGTDTFTYRANNGTFTYTNAVGGGTTTVQMNSENSGLVTVTINVVKK
jgi:hypothetical protein